MINPSVRSLIFLMAALVVCMYFFGACDDAAIRGR